MFLGTKLINEWKEERMDTWEYMGEKVNELLNG